LDFFFLIFFLFSFYHFLFSSIQIIAIAIIWIEEDKQQTHKQSIIMGIIMGKHKKYSLFSLLQL